MYIKTEYQQELEQTIVQFNSNLSAIDQLQTLSQQLNFQITYMCVDTKGSQQSEFQIFKSLYAILGTNVMADY